MTRPSKALILSFFTACLLGCAFAFTYWMSANPELGFFHCAAFVVLMDAVYFVGYCLGKRQPATLREQPEPRACVSILEAYGEPINSSIAQHLILFVFASLLLDAGTMMRLTTISAAGSWVFTVLIITRRPRTPTHADVLIVKYGFWLAALAVVVLTLLMGRTF